VIGRKCERQIYYSWRWFSDTKHSGRLLRLFDRGHREEAPVWKWLEMAGCKFAPGSGTYKFSDADMHHHCGGELDGVILSGITEAPTTPHLLEIKTHSKGSFEKLKPAGVLKAKPEHWAQMQLYMGYTSLKRALYWAVCKDNDYVYTERIHFDADLFTELKVKAQRLIFTDTIPAPLDEKRTSGECFFCDHKAVCKGEDAPARNCRTCIHSVPAPGKTWHCNHHDQTIPESVDVDGCPSYTVIT
jgi:hypothetical protein